MSQFRSHRYINRHCIFIIKIIRLSYSRISIIIPFFNLIKQQNNTIHDSNSEHWFQQKLKKNESSKMRSWIFFITSKLSSSTTNNIRRFYMRIKEGINFTMSYKYKQIKILRPLPNMIQEGFGGQHQGLVLGMLVWKHVSHTSCND